MQPLKDLVRIAYTDIDGRKAVLYGLARIYGVGENFANAVCIVNKLDKNKKIGALDEKEIKAIEATIENPEKIPKWMWNRKKEISTGKDEHMVGPQLKLRHEFDIRRLKKIKSYRGIRHAMGLPVRGQKTRSHFIVGRSVGVVKKAQKVQMAAKGSDKGSRDKKK